MGYTNTDTNMTTSTGISAGMLTYYNRVLLKYFEPNLVHLQFADVHPMPLNNGLIQNFRKLVPVETKTTELVEGNPGDGVLLAETAVNVELKQYVDYGRFTDKFDFANADIKIAQKVELFGDAGARSIDTLVRDELATCPNVIYAGGKASRSALTTSDKITSLELRKAVRTLKKNKAKPFDGGYYVAIVGPDVIYSLQEDESFVSVAQYQNKEAIFTGEVGRLWGIRFVESTEAKIFEGAGASSADVASVIVLGKYAYGITTWKGAKPRVIIKPAGSAGTADPLDQINTVGWKMDGFGVKLLQPEFAVRIEAGVQA